MQSAIYSFCDIGRLDSVDATLPRLLDQGYFLVFFGQVKIGAQVSGKMLLLLQRDNFENLQLEKRASGGQYFLFRADLFKGYNLKGHLNNFGFLKYSLSESIVLSGKELHIIEALFSLIGQECTSEAPWNTVFHWYSKLMRLWYKCFKMMLIFRSNEDFVSLPDAFVSFTT
ncbi:hypothetical protein [Sphingobacterium bambusae]|uniref:Uncharacterized protein n=1 Tax=Sphingobacterium bambusae TaxID=662858 RepID=A0ABW6BCY9_9SPHI|nr:hypothetical protein [Sphingobacterium bambusae]WPL48555.1 hypothetical protein SCB77_21640 [Sphingobacterium bambusae]